MGSTFLCFVPLLLTGAICAQESAQGLGVKSEARRDSTGERNQIHGIVLSQAPLWGQQVKLPALRFWTLWLAWLLHPPELVASRRKVH